jgi:hypothetical protein
MPADRIVLSLNQSLSPDNIDKTAKNVSAFAPGGTMDADFIYSPGTEEHDQLSASLRAMPPAVKEVIRATIYHALTSRPRVPVVVTLRPAYYFGVSVFQIPPTTTPKGVITLAIETPLPPGDLTGPNSTYPASPGASASRKSSKRGAPKPASRKPSRRSSKSS